MKQSKNNSNDNIVSGRLSAGPRAPKSGAARQAGTPSYGANRLGIVSNEEAAVATPPAVPAQSHSPAPQPDTVATGNTRMGAAPAGAAKGQAGRAGCQTFPNIHPTFAQPTPAQPTSVHPVFAQPALAHPTLAYKDAASPAQALKPTLPALQQGPMAGPVLPALSRPYGLAGAPKRDASRLDASANPHARSPLDDLWARSVATAVEDDLSQPDAQAGAGHRHKMMLAAGGVILLLVIVWACWPGSSKSAYPPVPQAAQASPTQVQAVPQPAPLPARDTPLPPAEVAPTQIGNPSGLPGVRADAPPGVPADASPSASPAYPQGDDNHGQAFGTTDGDGQATATTRPAQDVAPSRPAAQTQPAKPVEPQYRPCPAGIRLTGIVQQAGRKVACINGKFRDVGDTVYGAKVVEIKDLSVEMEQDGQRFLVGFGSPTDNASDEDAPAEEDKPSDDAPKAAKPDPDTQPTDTPQPPAKKKHKFKVVDDT